MTEALCDEDRTAFVISPQVFDTHEGVQFDNSAKTSQEEGTQDVLTGIYAHEDFGLPGKLNVMRKAMRFIMDCKNLYAYLLLSDAGWLSAKQYGILASALK